MFLLQFVNFVSEELQILQKLSNYIFLLFVVVYVVIAVFCINIAQPQKRTCGGFRRFLTERSIVCGDCCR